MPHMFTHKKEELPVNLKNHKTIHDMKKKEEPLVKPKTHTHTHTHTQLQTFQISKKGNEDQSKHTPRRGNKNPYKHKFNQTRIINTGNRSEFKSHWVPHLKGLVPHMFSYKINKLETFFFSSYNVWKHMQYPNLISWEPGW